MTRQEVISKAKEQEASYMLLCASRCIWFWRHVWRDWAGQYVWGFAVGFEKSGTDGVWGLGSWFVDDGPPPEATRL